MIPDSFGRKWAPPPFKYWGMRCTPLLLLNCHFRNDARQKSGKKSHDDEAKENDKISEIVRILEPILPASVLDHVSLKLYEHATNQISELLDTFGVLQEFGEL